jgi:aminoglycoside phosphotransferase (APT) family kinase protein
MREGLLVAIGSESVLRLAVGPARTLITRQVAALEALSAARAPELDRRLIPWTLAAGRAGLADWSLEPRLPGTTPSPALSERVVAGCVDFLAALHRSRRAGDPHADLAADAEEVASVCTAEGAATVRALACGATVTLAGVPRGFGHGDFFRGNLLVHDDSVAGVIDWDAASPGRLPLLDLIHVRHMSKHPVADRDWGPTIVAGLLPWVAAGGDNVARAYCRRIGLEPSSAQLAALATAYWLERLAYQLRTFADRRRRPVWRERNVDLVLDALARFEPTASVRAAAAAPGTSAG